MALNQAAPLPALPTPRYILDYENWTIHVYSSVKASVEASKGYGIISYTWGRWQDNDKAAPDGPSFSDEIPVEDRWDIPVVKDTFTMADVKATLAQLKMKYVWWDWACVPQSWKSTKTRPGQPGKLIGSLSDAGEAKKAEEIAKQIFTYTQATKGIVWAHNTIWTGSPSEKKSALEAFLMRPKGETDDDVMVYLAKLEALVDGEKWFSSMWTFQEGVLLETDRALDPRDGSPIPLRAARGHSILLDRRGTTLDDDSFFHGGNASVFDITARATLHATDFVTDLKEKMLVPLKQRTPEWRAVVKTLSEALAGFTSTGLVSYIADGPIILLEASKSRGDVERARKDPESSYAADYSVNAVLGAMEVQLPVDVNPNQIESLRAGFMLALVERYQWRMLLVAKQPGGSMGSGSTPAKGHWLSILGLKWEFCSVGHWIATTLDTVKENGRFVSKVAREPVTTGKQVWVALPDLAFDRKSGAVVLRGEAMRNFFIHQGTPAWTHCEYYRHKLWASGKRSKNIIDYKLVPYKDAQTVFGKQLAFLPFENLGENQQRCLVLKDFVAQSATGKAAGVFVGIVDVSDLVADGKPIAVAEISMF